MREKIEFDTCLIDFIQFVHQLYVAVLEHKCYLSMHLIFALH